eukprot:535057_1
MCLLFLLHFSPSKYVKCNYCFVIEEKHMTANDRFMIKFNELKNENEKLKTTENELTQKINQLSQSFNQATNTINTLTQRIEQLEANINNANELKSEEMDLNLLNNWVNWRQRYGYGPAKAIKIGRIVYLMGSIKNDENGCNIPNGVVAVLPEGWRPPKNVEFFRHTATCWAVCSNGNIRREFHHHHRQASLDGISFII